MTKIIAEIGWNHLGNLNLAKKMIMMAKLNGADFVKTQIFDTKYLNPGPWDHDGRKNIYKKAQLDQNKYRQLFNFAKKNKIKFFASVVNKHGVDLLKKFQDDIIKIPSAHNRDLGLIKYSLDRFKKVIISLGSMNKKDLNKLLKLINKKRYCNKSILFYCVSVYPCDFKYLNLNLINYLKKKHKYIGFSDHTSGIIASALSLKFNPVMIEKHFTINKKLPGRDNALAILPSDLKMLKSFVDINKIINKNKKSFNYIKKEEIIRKIYSKRWSG